MYARLFLALLLVFAAVSASGCGRGSPASNSDSSDGSGEKGWGLPTRIAKAMDLPDFANDLRQIQLLYFQFDVAHNRPPRSEKEFLAYIKRDAANIVKWVNKDYYRIVPNAKILNPEHIIAYQAKDIREGAGLVLFGDQRVEYVPTGELERRLKQQGVKMQLHGQ